MRKEGPSAVRAAYVVASFSFDAGLSARRALWCEEGLAGLEVEDDRARAGGAHVLRVQRPGELSLERAARPGLRGRDEEQGDECHCRGGEDGRARPFHFSSVERNVKSEWVAPAWKMGHAAHSGARLARRIIVGRCRCGSEIVDLLQMPEDGAGAPSLDAIESTLTDGYAARRLQLEAERSRIERRLGEVARDAGEVEPHDVAAELAAALRAPRHGGRRARAASLAPRQSPGPPPRRPRSRQPRRSRSARRRRPPGCGCRSGAS